MKSLDKFGQVWTSLDKFGKFGLVWTSLDKFGHEYFDQVEECYPQMIWQKLNNNVSQYTVFTYKNLGFDKISNV